MKVGDLVKPSLYGEGYIGIIVEKKFFPGGNSSLYKVFWARTHERRRMLSGDRWIHENELIGLSYKE